MHRPSRHKEIILYYFFHHRLQPLVTNKRPICSESPDYQGHHSQGRNAPLGTTSRHRTTTLTRATAAQQGYIRIQFSSQLQSTTRGPRQPVAQSFEKCNCVCPVLNTDLKPTVLIGKSLSCIMYRDKKSQTVDWAVAGSILFSHSLIHPATQHRSASRTGEQPCLHPGSPDISPTQDSASAPRDTPVASRTFEDPTSSSSHSANRDNGHIIFIAPPTHDVRHRRHFSPAS